MNSKLPARPNLEHLRTQAKALLAKLKEGDGEAALTFIEHLPAARQMTPDDVRGAGFRLADAQSAIARKSGFESWPSLTRHVDQLRKFEGAWEFVDLEIDGATMPVEAMTGSRILMDGDRFRMESPEATYEGIFNIDVEKTPHHIDIEFIDGPEAGNYSFGIYELNGDTLKICLGLAGFSRPESFATSPNSGHALENLRRASKSRPEGVEGGRPPMSEVVEVHFQMEMTPLLESLQGEWLPVELVKSGQGLPKHMLAMGYRIMNGNETKVVFGGQAMVHAKVRIDETVIPIAVDYYNLAGPAKGKVTYGAMDWVGEDVRFCMASAGDARPDDFTCEKGSGRTLSQWRRK